MFLRSATCSWHRPLKTRLKPGPFRPAFDRHIDVSRIDVEPTEATPSPLGRHERGSGSEEEIEHEIASSRHIQDRIGDEPRRLDRRDLNGFMRALPDGFCLMVRPGAT